MSESLTAPHPEMYRPACARPASRGRAAALAAALAMLLATGAGAPATPASSCPDSLLERGHVDRVSPAGDLVLADGAVLRLAGLAGGGAGAEVAWRPRLARLVAGREIVFSAGGPLDRYGRRPVRARVAPAGPHERTEPPASLLQQVLLGEGLALARPEEGLADCLPAWLEAEATARSGRRGLWRELPLEARNVEAIRARQGRFTIVEGRVLDVGKSSRVDYLNFGRVWRQDMTGRVEGPGRVALQAQGIAPEDLAGRRVSLRGTVFESGGPAVAIRRAGQLEWDHVASREMDRDWGETGGRARPTGDE